MAAIPKTVPILGKSYWKHNLEFCWNGCHCLFQEDHASGHITPREFQRRLAFCSRKLNQARMCLNDGFSPADGCPEKSDKTGTESIHRRLERRAKQKIWHLILCRSQLMDPKRVRFESFVNIKKEEKWKKKTKKLVHILCWSKVLAGHDLGMRLWKLLVKLLAFQSFL